MRIFRPRGRLDMVSSPTSPLAQAAALHAAGRYADAEREARYVAASRARRRDDAWLPLALGVAALAVGAQGRHAEAVALYDEALPLFTRIYGGGRLLTLKARSDRAQALTSLGRHAECEAECAAVASAAAGSREPEARTVALAARNGRVFALSALGRHAEAEALAREALANVRGLPERFVLVLRLNLARSLNGQSRHAEALAELKPIEMAHRAAAAPQRHQEAGAVDLAVATALFGLGRRDEARIRATAGHDACRAVLGPDHSRTAEARELIGRIDAA
ncbi:tetratricopeptide repeat protein [Streptomyces pseudogriseolus]|uniref:tetratricopeptide repeat protein n=1 Tax=Streptomyces pseudogriseolus TaxID=36817 RepID=UPI0032474F1E